MTATQTTTLAALHRADGSASYTHGGYTILSAVNGPIEVQRRDEIPDEAAIEVNVRPAVGVGGPRERHIETLLHAALRTVILTHQYPRSLIQITLQILSTPEDSSPQSTSHISFLAPLLNAAVPALLHAGVPMSHVPVAGTCCVSRDGEVETHPSPRAIAQAKSVHVFAFTSPGERMLMAESEGEFSKEEWRSAGEVVRKACLGSNEGGRGENGMVVDSSAQQQSVLDHVRRAVEVKVAGDEKWREQGE